MINHCPLAPIKEVEQQAGLIRHRARAFPVAARTARVNHNRGLLGEYGLVMAQGIAKVRTGRPEILEDPDNGLLARVRVRETFADLAEQRRRCDEHISEYDRRITALARASEPAQRLMPVEGVGPLTATALTASVGNARQFRNGQQFAAWLGLVARQRAYGGKIRRHGPITKRGNAYLRILRIRGVRALTGR